MNTEEHVGGNDEHSDCSGFTGLVSVFLGALNELHGAG